MTTEAAPPLPDPSDDDDGAASPVSSSSEGADDEGEDEFERTPPTRHHGSLAYSVGPPGMDPSSLMSQGGSWYFHPSQASAVGGQSAFTPPAGGGPPQPLPPHLAYWWQGGPAGSVSDITYQHSSYDQRAMGQMAAAAAGGYGGGGGTDDRGRPDLTHLLPPDEKFTVYSSRWFMLLWMSLLNFMSDWTCYSVAPIAILTQKAFGEVDPESLVTVFLGANAVASAMEPAILGRLGLRRTVLFGSFLMMIGSIIKSGGFRGMFVAGEAQTLKELEEEEADETWRLYLGFFLVGLSQPLYQCTPALLSASWFPEDERTMATGVALNSNQLGIGAAFVFGTLLVATEEDIVPYFGLLSVVATITFIGTALQFDDAPPTPPSDTARVIKGDLEIKLPKFLTGRFGGQKKEESTSEDKMKAAKSPTPADESVEVTTAGIHDVAPGYQDAAVAAPSPAPTEEPVDAKTPKEEDVPPVHAEANHPFQSPGAPPPMPPYPNPYAMMPPPGYYPYPPAPSPGIRSSVSGHPSYYHGYDPQGHYHNALLEESGDYHNEFGGEDAGAEPVLTQLDHQLDIDVRDDQLVQQFKACFRRKGFSHCIVAFTTSGIIVNTLSTFMDYLVTLNGAGREYVGIVGGTFQMLIMCASLVFGGWTDHSRKYYFIILAMLIFGAFALAVCNVNLDTDAGGDLRFNLLIVAVLAGPLQPLSTELGVEVVYPLSENTVLVIQQLFSNLLSAAFIPVFKAMRNVGTATDESEIKGMFEVPQYTFSFYMLIIIHAFSTCYFASFNGTYLRHEAELDKKAKKEEEKARLLESLHTKHAADGGHGYGSLEPN